MGLWVGMNVRQLGKHIRTNSYWYGAFFCSILVTVIFSFRWRTSLPFSGYMPIATQYDMLGYWGRYVVYVNESFHFPLGLIKGLSFPFEDANITRGSIPLFAIPLKALSKIFPSVADFYYLVLVEFVAVFFCGLFSYRILHFCKVRGQVLLIVGASLVSLSFPLMYRSSYYFGNPTHVLFFPIYLAFFYYCLSLLKHQNIKVTSCVVLLFIVAALTDYYAFFALCFIVFVLICLFILKFIISRESRDKSIIAYLVLALIVGYLLAGVSLSAVGNQSNLSAPKDSVMRGRLSTDWGYGGGYGGGFHVADLLTLVIPPNDDPTVPKYKRNGPTSLLVKMGFPITTNDIGDGQYEGFTYLGTVLIFIWCGIFIRWFFWSCTHFSILFNGLKSWRNRIRILFHSDDGNILLFGVAVACLFVMSWGYILHVGGVRFNSIPTPSMLLALAYPKFMLARSLGRLAVPFMLFVGLAGVVVLSRISVPLLSKGSVYNKYFSLIIVALLFVHIVDISGYLVPTEVINGNEIKLVFNDSDRKLIREVTRNKSALLVFPKFKFNHEWTKICYSLAYYSDAPVSGATIGPPGELPEHLDQYKKDLKDLSDGKLNKLRKQYGDFVIAASTQYADVILSKSDLGLVSYPLVSQDVVLLRVLPSF